MLTTPGLKETQRIQDERHERLATLGIQVADGGIKVELEFYLLNLNADPAMNELLVYNLKVSSCADTRACTAHMQEHTLAGSDMSCNIRLSGLAVAPKHVWFHIENQTLIAVPVDNAK